MPYCQGPADRKTRAAAANRTMADIPFCSLYGLQELLLFRHSGIAVPHELPQPPFPIRISSELEVRSLIRNAAAPRPGWQAENVRPVRKSCRANQLSRYSARPTTLGPPVLQWAPRPKLRDSHPQPQAQAAPCDPLSRWPSAASSASARLPREPCTPATAPEDAPAALFRSHVAPQPTLPVFYFPLHPAFQQRPAPHRDGSTKQPRSLPIQSGILALSPAGPNGRGTPRFRL